MGVPSSRDQEALDALFRRARAEPSAEHVDRVKQRLHALAREVETPRGRSASGALVSCLVVIGFSLLPGPRETIVGRAAPEPAAVAIAAEPPVLPSVPDAVPVEELAPAQDEPRAEPVTLPPAERDRALGDRRPARARAEPLRASASKPAEGAVAAESPALPPTTKTSAEEQEPARVAEVAREEGEASFLRRAKVALATDPAHALRLTDEHPARYPRGVLLQEREIIAIEALIRLGRAGDARARAASFRARFPASAHHGHLDGEIERLLERSTNAAPR